MKVKRISEQEFNQIDGCHQIIAEEYARQFATLKLSNNVYGLAWNSGELIEPEVVLLPDGQAAWVGVNQYLVVIEVETGHVRVSMKLLSNILEIIAVERLVAVRAEIEILLFKQDFSILFDECFPDITEKISIINDKLSIQFLEGYTFLLDIQTGELTRQKFSLKE